MFCIIAVTSITILTGTSCVYTNLSLHGVGGGLAEGWGLLWHNHNLLLIPPAGVGLPGALSLAYPSPVPVGSGGCSPWLCPGLSSLLSQEGFA